MIAPEQAGRLAASRAGRCHVTYTPEAEIVIRPSLQLAQEEDRDRRDEDVRNLDKRTNPDRRAAADSLNELWKQQAHVGL